MLPSIISEKSIQQFKYWAQGVQQGMRYGNQLYVLHRSYAISDRLSAYSLGCQLSEQRIKVCLTVSDHGYAVWVELRSPATSSAVDTLSNSVPAFSREVFA